MDRGENGATQSGLRAIESTATGEWVGCGVKRDQNAEVLDPVRVRRVRLTEDRRGEAVFKSTIWPPAEKKPRSINSMETSLAAASIFATRDWLEPILEASCC
jgi:hypothetical protein